MQNEIEYEKEIFENTDRAVEFITSFHLADLQLSEQCSNKVKQKSYGTRIATPDSSSQQNCQANHGYQRYQPPWHGMAVIHNQKYQSRNEKKIDQSDIPSEPLEFS